MRGRGKEAGVRSWCTKWVVGVGMICRAGTRGFRAQFFLCRSSAQLDLVEAVVLRGDVVIEYRHCPMPCAMNATT